MKRIWQWLNEGPSIYVPMKWIKLAIFMTGMGIMFVTWSKLVPDWVAVPAAVMMIGVLFWQVTDER